MKANKQAQELENKLKFIDEKYANIIIYFSEFLDDGYQMHLFNDIIDKAKAWDIFRAKCAKGAKVASGNLSRKERIDRARKASQAKTEKAQKEKARKELDRTKRGKTRTKTEHSA